MTGRPHTLTPHGIEGLVFRDRYGTAHLQSSAPDPRDMISARPEAQRFAPHDLQALQDALVGAPFTLAELVAAIVRSPKSLASVVKTAGAR